MVLGQDLAEASSILDGALDRLSVDKERWLLEIIVENNEWSVSIRERRDIIGKLLGWPRRKVPKEIVVRYILETLGVDFLRLVKVRETLLKDLSMEAPDKYAKLSDLISGEENSSVDPSVLSQFDFRMGTRLSLLYCELLGLSSSFSSRGTSDNRKSMEMIHAVKKLPPLMDFQSRIQTLSEETFNSNDGRCMVVMPTGSGKTRTSIESALKWLISNSEWPSTLIWIADREELCEQAYQSFRTIFVNTCQELEAEFEIPEHAEIWRYWGGIDKRNSTKSYDSKQPGIIVTSIQQLQSRISSNDLIVEDILSSADVVIVDEVHRNLDFIEELDSKFRTNICNTRMIGLTATPMRRDRNETARLLQLFEQNVLSPIEGGEEDIESMTLELTNRGILAKRKNLDPYELIDYNLLSSQYGEQSYLEKIILLILTSKEMGCKSILVFTKTVEHARIISSCLRLQNEQIEAQYLDANTPTEIRKNIIQEFKNGTIEVLLNYGILTTGFDAPNTDSVIICRTLESDDSLFKQMVGRGLRGTEFGGTDDCVIIHFEEDY